MTHKMTVFRRTYSKKVFCKVKTVVQAALSLKICDSEDLIVLEISMVYLKCYTESLASLRKKN